MPGRAGRPQDRRCQRRRRPPARDGACRAGRPRHARDRADAGRRGVLAAGRRQGPRNAHPLRLVRYPCRGRVGPGRPARDADRAGARQCALRRRALRPQRADARRGGRRGNHRRARGDARVRSPMVSSSSTSPAISATSIAASRRFGSFPRKCCCCAPTTRCSTGCASASRVPGPTCGAWPRSMTTRCCARPTRFACARAPWSSGSRCPSSAGGGRSAASPPASYVGLRFLSQGAGDAPIAPGRLVLLSAMAALTARPR